MRVHFKAMESYGAGSTASQAVVADKVELIQMLFDGLLESLAATKGHIQNGAIVEKGKSGCGPLRELQRGKSGSWFIRIL